MQQAIISACALALLLAAGPLAAAENEDKSRASPDKRQILELPPDERHLVLQEMRNFVLAIKEINEGLAANEMAKVTDAARRMGSDAASAIPPRVVKKLPDPFKRMAGKVHSSFDRIALDAETMGDRGLALEQLGRLMGQCVACHETYQIREVPFETTQ